MCVCVQSASIGHVLKKSAAMFLGCCFMQRQNRGTMSETGIIIILSVLSQILFLFHSLCRLLPSINCASACLSPHLAGPDQTAFTHQTSTLPLSFFQLFLIIAARILLKKLHRLHRILTIACIVSGAVTLLR